jgi:DNA-binding CsgD family transcriptional regulator
MDVCAGPMGFPRRLPVSWAAASAQIVEHLEDARLPALLVQALRTVIPFAHCYQFVYRRETRPIPVYETVLTPRAKLGVANYVNNTYAIHPFFRKYCRGLESGVYRVPDLATGGCPAQEDLASYRISPTPAEEIGYLTEGWPPGRHELYIALEMPMGECAEIALARDVGEGSFSPADMAALAPIVPFLSAAFRRFWRQARSVHLGAQVSSTHRDLDFATAGRHLSAREIEIAQLLLRGHSTLSISHHLGIATTTVKTHRKNLYAKLGIATQLQLFALCRRCSPA